MWEEEEEGRCGVEGKGKEKHWVRGEGKTGDLGTLNLNKVYVVMKDVRARKRRVSKLGKILGQEGKGGNFG